MGFGSSGGGGGGGGGGYTVLASGQHDVPSGTTYMQELADGPFRAVEAQFRLVDEDAVNAENADIVLGRAGRGNVKDGVDGKAYWNQPETGWAIKWYSSYSNDIPVEWRLIEWVW